MLPVGNHECRHMDLFCMPGFWSSYPVPDFVVEVLSDSTGKRDRGIKMEDYALNGVQKYWLVSPDRREVEQYIPEDSAFRLKEKTGHGTVCCVVLSGLEIPVQAIFE